MSKEPSPKDLYKASGIAIIVTAVLFIVGIGSLFSGTPGMGFLLTGEEAFNVLPANALAFQAQRVLFFISPMVLLFALPGLYHSLRGVGKWLIAVSVLLFVVAVTLDTASALINNSLVTLSNNYASAANEAQRAAYLAAADLVVDIVSVLQVAVMFTNGLAGIMVSLAMLKGVFSKAMAYVGLAAGLIFVSVSGLPLEFMFIAMIVGQPLFLIWKFATGYKLYKLG